MDKLIQMKQKLYSEAEAKLQKVRSSSENFQPYASPKKKFVFPKERSKVDRGVRLSSKQDSELTYGKIKQIIENNKFFPHLYNPYFERKDVKANMITVLQDQAHLHPETVVRRKKPRYKSHEITIDTMAKSQLPIKKQIEVENLEDRLLSTQDLKPGPKIEQSQLEPAHHHPKILHKASSSADPANLHVLEGKSSSKFAQMAKLASADSVTAKVEKTAESKEGSLKSNFGSLLTILTAKKKIIKNRLSSMDTKTNKSIDYVNDDSSNSNSHNAAVQETEESVEPPPSEPPELDQILFNGAGDGKAEKKLVRKERMQTSIAYRILNKLDQCLQTDVMNMINLRDPITYRSIMYITESELYKYKRKLYPKSVNNMGDGYSQFYNDATRIAILREVKQILLRKKGLSGAKLLDEHDQILMLLEKSIELLQINLKDEGGNQQMSQAEIDKKRKMLEGKFPPPPESNKNSNLNTPKISSREKMLEKERQAQLAQLNQAANEIPKNPYAHLRVKGVERLIKKLKNLNTKEKPKIFQYEAHQYDQLEIKKKKTSEGRKKRKSVSKSSPGKSASPPKSPPKTSSPPKLMSASKSASPPPPQRPPILSQNTGTSSAGSQVPVFLTEATQKVALRIQNNNKNQDIYSLTRNTHSSQQGLSTIEKSKFKPADLAEEAQAYGKQKTEVENTKTPPQIVDLPHVRGMSASKSPVNSNITAGKQSPRHSSKSSNYLNQFVASVDSQETSKVKGFKIQIDKITMNQDNESEKLKQLISNSNIQNIGGQITISALNDIQDDDDENEITPNDRTMKHSWQNQRMDDATLKQMMMMQGMDSESQPYQLEKTKIVGRKGYAKLKNKFTNKSLNTVGHKIDNPYAKNALRFMQDIIGQKPDGQENLQKKNQQKVKDYLEHQRAEREKRYEEEEKKKNQRFKKKQVSNSEIFHKASILSQGQTVANIKIAKPASPPQEKKEGLSDATTNIDHAMQTVTSMRTMEKRVVRPQKTRPRKQSLSIQQKQFISELNNTSNLNFQNRLLCNKIAHQQMQKMGHHKKSASAISLQRYQFNSSAGSFNQLSQSSLQVNKFRRIGEPMMDKTGGFMNSAASCYDIGEQLVPPHQFETTKVPSRYAIKPSLKNQSMQLASELDQMRSKSQLQGKRLQLGEVIAIQKQQLANSGRSFSKRGLVDAGQQIARSGSVASDLKPEGQKSILIKVGNLEGQSSSMSLQQRQSRERSREPGKRVQISEAAPPMSQADQESTMLMDTIKTIQNRHEQVEKEKEKKHQVWDQPEHKRKKRCKINPLVQQYIGNLMNRCEKENPNTDMNQLSASIRKQVLQLYADPFLETELSGLKEEYGVIEKGITQILEINSQERTKLALQKHKKELQTRLEVIKEQIQEEIEAINEQSQPPHKQNDSQRSQKRETVSMKPIQEEGESGTATPVDPLAALRKPLVGQGSKKRVLATTQSKVFGPLAQSLGDIFKKRKRRDNMSKRELQNELNDLNQQRKTVEHELAGINEKIDHINNNIEEGEENPELYLIEEMLTLFHKQKEFDVENFSATEAVKQFRNDNVDIANFIARNQPTSAQDLKNKIWKPEKYNFNRKNPMCEFIRKFD